MMSKGIFSFDKLSNHLNGYLETKIELLKYDTKEQVVSGLVKLGVLLFLGIPLLMLFLMVNIAVAIMINGWLESIFLGYLILGGIYGIIVICLLLFVDQKSIYRAIAESINEEITKQKNGKSEEDA